MKLLFVDTNHVARSKTAALVFKNTFDTRSAGLNSSDPLNKEQLAWADVVMVMEDEHKMEIARKFPEFYMEKPVLSLNVKGKFRFDQPELRDLIREKVYEKL